MRVRLAVIGLCLVAAGSPAAADPAGDTAAALAPVAAALDGAAKAADACPQERAAARARLAIFNARQMLGVARSNPDAILALNEKMDTLREALAQCLSFRQLAERYHAKCQGDVRLGMTREEVRQSTWCEPSKVLRTDTSDHSREEWIYTIHAGTTFLGRPEGFLYFTDGKLTSIERAVP
ncbi:MAG TPA: hypothetical protein VGG57_03290 [Stellaceae bacterium]|jgi:hypothetical protein